MSKFIQLEPDVFVAGQLTEADFGELAALGIRSVVSNRPEDESDDQIPIELAENAAQGHGIGFAYQPVWNFDVADEDAVSGFARLLAELPGPVLFYCRSGRRSTLLWAQASLERLGLAAVLQAAEMVGHARDDLLAILDERAQQVAA